MSPKQCRTMYDQRRATSRYAPRTCRRHAARCRVRAWRCDMSRVVSHHTSPRAHGSASVAVRAPAHAAHEAGTFLCINGCSSEAFFSRQNSPRSGAVAACGFCASQRSVHHLGCRRQRRHRRAADTTKLSAQPRTRAYAGQAHSAGGRRAPLSNLHHHRWADWFAPDLKQAHPYCAGHSAGAAR